MRIFKVKTFARFQRKERIPDADLVEAITRAGEGLVDAELGGNVIKQRVARQGEGRSGGYRTLIAFHAGQRAVFMFGFAKNERDNINPKELAMLHAQAKVWLEAKPPVIDRALKTGSLQEVTHDQER